MAATARPSATSAYSGGRLNFSVSTSAKARGLQAMLPARSATGPLSRLTRDGQPASWNRRTVKGVDYIVFDGKAGSYEATYANDTTAPAISGVSATADAEGHATVKWTTDEPATSVVEYGRTTALGTEKADSAQVTDHSLELGGLQPNTNYNFRVRSADSAGNTASSPAGAPATFSTPPGALVDSRTAEFAAGTQSTTLAGDSLDALDGEVQLQPTVAEDFNGTSLSAPWTMRAFDAGGSVALGGGVLLADDAVAHTTGFYDPPRVIEFSAAFRPVNDQAVGFGTDLTQAPFAAFSTGVDGDPFQLYASSVAGGGLPEIDTPLPGVSLGAAHRFRIEWTPTRVDFFVDGANVATHNHSETIDGPLRPAISDFGLFGASTKVHWLRMGGYGTTGLFTSRVLDSGPGASTWATLSATSTVPTGTGITYETRSGATATPGGTWSGWQAVGTGGAIASPAARFIQYRARLTSSSGRVTPTLQRVQIGYGAGTDRPAGGWDRVDLAGRAEDQPGRDGDAQRVQRPRRRSAHLPLPLVPQRPGDRGRDLQLAQPRLGGQRRPRRQRARRGVRHGRSRRGERPGQPDGDGREHGADCRQREHPPDVPVHQRRGEGRRQRLRGHRQRHAHVPLPVVPQRDGDQRRDIADARPLAGRQRRPG